MNNLDDPWTRDFSSALLLDNGDTGDKIIRILTPRTDGVTSSNKNKDAVERAQVINSLSSIAQMSDTNIEIIKAPFWFMGGNITFDKDGDGKSRVFVGYDLIAYDKKTRELPDDQRKEVIETRKKYLSKFFSGASIHVIGDEQQHDTAMFHIDQSFLLLPDKQAVVVKPLVDDNLSSQSQADVFVKLIDSQKALLHQLEGLGYTVHELEHSYTDCMKTQFSVNAIPYTDKNTGQSSIILPVYQDDCKDHAKNNGTTLSADDIQGKALDAYTLFVSLGMEIKLIRNSAEGEGGPHCLLNQFASLNGEATQQKA